MIVFRSTKRLIARLRVPVSTDPPLSTGMLGDWYANTLNVGRARYVLCLSERTLLPVIVPARKAEFLKSFTETLASLLQELGIDPEPIASEVATSSPAVFARTQSRVLLGALNDFGWNAAPLFQHSAAPTPDLLDVSRLLAQMPSKPIGYSSPDRVTREMFGVGSLR